MSYFRRGMHGMGDGPITDPSQLENGSIVATVPPTRAECGQLPADSPYRQPGQVCAPSATSTNGGGPFGWLLGLIKSGTEQPPAPSAAAQPASAADSTTLLWGAAALGALYYFTRKKR